MGFEELNLTDEEKRFFMPPEEPLPLPDPPEVFAKYPPQLKDTGDRIELGGGMVREPSRDRTDYTLVLDGPMFTRWAEHLTLGAKKYSPRNWMLALGGTPPERAETRRRAKESAFRHFVQWFYGDSDEDHAAAVFFNINEHEYLKEAE